MPALTEVMMKFVRLEHAAMKEPESEEAKAAAMMVQLWNEVGEQFIRRVREEFPSIREYQDIVQELREAWGLDRD